MEIKREVVMLPIDEVIPYQKNAKLHPESQIVELAAMIAEFGWDQPIVIDAENRIIKGHGRLLAALRLKLEQVPCIVNPLDRARGKASRIADNKISETGWDEELLKEDLQELASDEDVEDIEALMDLTGFDEEDFKAIGLNRHNLVAGNPENSENQGAAIKEKELDENISTNKECPSCGYVWS